MQLNSFPLWRNMFAVTDHFSMHPDRSRGTAARSGLSLLIGGLASCVSQAVEPEDILHLKVGNLNIRPKFSTALTANDNIFFRDGSAASQALYGAREGDVISEWGTGFGAVLGRNPINTLGFGYNYLHRFYTDHTEVSSGDHAAQFGAAMEQGRFRFSTDHSLSLLTGIQGGNTWLVQQNDRLVLSDAMRVSLDITPKSDLYLSGQYGMTDQEEGSQFNDIESWSLAGGYGFQYSEKLRFFAQTSYGVQTSSRANRSWSWDFVGGSVGAEGDFTDKLTGTLQFGYQQRSSSLTGERGGAPTVTMELEQLLGRRTQISLSYTRANQVNVDAVDSTSVSDQVRLSLSRALGNRQKWFASVFASYWRNDFSASGGAWSGRSDEATSLGATLDYRIQEWMTSRLGYSFADFTSEIPSWALGGIDYQVNQVSLSVNVGF